MSGKFIYKYHWVIIVGTLAVCIWSVFLLPRLRTEVDFKNFFPKGNPALVEYESFTEQMGSSENMVILAVRHSSSVFDTLFLKKIQALQLYIDSLPETENSISILTLPKYYQNVFSFTSKRAYVSPDHPDQFRKDSITIFRDFLVTQHFISKDARTLKILIKLKNDLTFKKTDFYVNNIDTQVKNLDIGSVHFLGRKIMESEFVKVVNSELKTSLILSLLFIVIVLYLLHRSIAGVLIPLVCMMASLLMLYGYLAFFDRPLSIMANLFPTLILIVGISDAMHITGKYAFESKNTSDMVMAMNKTLSEIGVTTFINTFTTAIGFLTLLSMEMQTLREFGVDAAIGLMIAWINSVLFLPALLLKFNLSESFARPIQSKNWDTKLRAIVHFAFSYPRIISGSFILVIGISVIGLLNINTNNYMITSLPDKNRLENDFKFFNDTLEGGRSYELIIKTKYNLELNDLRIVRDIEKLENYLKVNHGVTEIISPVTGYKWLQVASDRKADWELPESQDVIEPLYSRMISQENKLILSIIDSTGTTGRLTGRMQDIGRKNMEMMYKNTGVWIDNNLDTSLVKFHHTGPDYMTDIGHQLRIDNMLESFWLEILAVSMVIGLIYRSWIMILVTFISNIIPIIIIGGLMGFTGIELRGSTTAIFAIGYVIAVDDTLHLINRFQLEKKKGSTTYQAIMDTMVQTGRPLVMTSMILLGGFAILMHSSFGDVFMHGFLISLIVVTGLISELLMTPILINYFYKEKQNMHE
jgi:predicted RND superfamily exporter protein